MIFSQFQRENADNVYTVVRNVSGSSLSAGYPCVLDVSASRDGVRVTQAAATTLALFRGIVAETIANSAYGKVQVHGFFTDASVINDASYAAVPGTPLKAVAGANYVTPYVTTTGNGYDGFLYTLETFATATTPAAAAKDVFIRAL